MSFVVSGQVLVVDAACLYEVLVGTGRALAIEARLLDDLDHAAPHLIDVEVTNVVRRDRMLERLDETAAVQALGDLEQWPGERFGHRPFIERVWELRHNVRGWDAFYVALAEGLDAPLLTLDGRLARSKGPRCVIELIPG